MVDVERDPTAGRYLTADVPGIGGRIKVRPEDFLVDEVPLYDPAGEGDHLYLTVEKRRRLTTDVVRLLAQHFRVPARAVGYAGLKDKHAITRQTFSIEHADEKKAGYFDDEAIKILGVDRHRNKLKRGHLAGNRFVIKVRDVEATAVLPAKRILDRLIETGVPNYHGEQRFGYRRNNHVLGRLLLKGELRAFLDEMLGKPVDDENPQVKDAREAYERGDYKAAIELWPKVHRFERQAVGPLSRGAPAKDAVNGIDYAQRSLLVSAFQSAIFNRLLDERLARGLFETLLEGDVAFKHTTRGRFVVEDAAVEQARYEAQEISPTGAMWGVEMLRARGEVDQWETAALEATGVTEAELAASEYEPAGSRRSFRMLVRDAEVSGGVDEHGGFVRLAFELGRGCFATSVLREIMKVGEATEGEEA